MSTIETIVATKINESVLTIARAVAEEIRASNALEKNDTDVVTLLLTEKEAAKMCGMSVAWLALGRCKNRAKLEEGRGRKYVPRPPYVKIGRRVRYPLAGVLEWQRTYINGNKQDEQE